MIIFPKHDNSMNQLRGTNSYIMDRWDLTMECIGRFYLDEDSPLYEVLDRDRGFYELFADFKGYVDFFFLQDCVSPDYQNVIFWQDDCSLAKTMPLPRTAGEHLVWIEKNIQFIKKRAEMMKRALASGVSDKPLTSCFAENENEYHLVEFNDTYFEVLDEIVNLLKNDPSLDVSTKRLRATRYYGGYARYIKINDYCCGILYDKDNWKDPESVMTPFWLSIKDSEWNLSDDIRNWLDKQAPEQIARKWQNQPCLALIPPVNTPFHQVCENLKDKIVGVIRSL